MIFLPHHWSDIRGTTGHSLNSTTFLPDGREGNMAVLHLFGFLVIKIFFDFKLLSRQGSLVIGFPFFYIALAKTFDQDGSVQLFLHSRYFPHQV